MPEGYAPAVFVSSTCYDLSQLRIDLKLFFESLGLDPVLSEHNSFPVNPDYDAVTNCLQVVKVRADVLVLIVGGRYGFQTDTGKSVTNLEYLEAKAKGIPIYVFVNKATLNILPIWEKNKEADYSNAEDTPKLLEFVESLRSDSDNWVFSFENAQDIIETLRRQLAYLFMAALEVRSRLQGKNLDADFSALGPKSLEILYVRPIGWEYRLFTEVLKESIASYRRERLDLLYGVTYGKAFKITSLGEFGDWMTTHIQEMTNTITAIEKLTNEGLPIAFGKPGVAGDATHIVYIATRIGDGYKKLLDWTLEFRKMRIDDAYKKLIELASHMADNLIPEIEEFA